MKKWFIYDQKKDDGFIEVMSSETAEEAKSELFYAWEHMCTGDKEGYLKYKYAKYMAVYADPDPEEPEEFDWDTVEDVIDLLKGLKSLSVGDQFVDRFGKHWEITHIYKDDVSVSEVNPEDPDYPDEDHFTLAEVWFSKTF